MGSILRPMGLETPMSWAHLAVAPVHVTYLLKQSTKARLQTLARCHKRLPKSNIKRAHASEKLPPACQVCGLPSVEEWPKSTQESQKGLVTRPTRHHFRLTQYFGGQAKARSPRLSPADASYLTDNQQNPLISLASRAGRRPPA